MSQAAKIYQYSNDSALSFQVSSGSGINIDNIFLSRYPDISIPEPNIDKQLSIPFLKTDPETILIMSQNTGHEVTKKSKI
jgi:hypothetical protein